MRTVTVGMRMMRGLVTGRLQTCYSSSIRRHPCRLVASSSADDKRLILTDAMALLYRSHFAFPHSNNHRLTTTQGRDTTVEFGFLSTLLSLLELVPRPTHVAVVFDASGKTFRHELYQGYKGQRPPAPEEVVNAIPVVLEMLKAMGVTSVRVPGVEADDVIGTLARRAVEEEGMTVAVASPDKDFFQLLRPGLILLRPPKKNQYVYDGGAGQKYSLVPYTEEDFCEEWQGLVPAQFVDVLALMGDSSDNVPGVPGIGPKMAVALMKQFGTLEEVLARREEATPKRAATALATEDAVAAARLSKQLVQLRTDVDVPATNIDIDAALRLSVPADGGHEAIRLCRELEFESHERRLRALWNTLLLD